MERERMEKAKLKAEKEKAEREKADKVVLYCLLFYSKKKLV